MVAVAVAVVVAARGETPLAARQYDTRGAAGRLKRQALVTVVIGKGVGILPRFGGGAFFTVVLSRWTKMRLLMINCK